MLVRHTEFGPVDRLRRVMGHGGLAVSNGDDLDGDRFGDGLGWIRIVVGENPGGSRGFFALYSVLSSTRR